MSSEKNLPEEIKTGASIIHKGYDLGDYRQEYVQYAYELGGIDFVTLIECENGQRNIHAKGDHGHAYGLCQMNDIYHKIPSEYFTSRQYQVEYCYEKFKGGTKFYGPNRIIKGQKCSNYVLNRFIIN